MSNITTTISLQEQGKINKISLHHQRNDSRELDVFEAARYFSGANEISQGRNSGQKSSMKLDHDDQPRQVQKGAGGRRMSLDIPSMRNSIPSQSCHAIILEEKPTNKEKKYYKQPSSPGGKLASFLNSLFNQTISSKKKKSKSTSTQSMKDEDESPGGGRRKRRSSISHFRSAKSNISHDTKSMYSTSSTTTATTTTTSGFRTPPPYGYMIPTKTCKDLRSYNSEGHKPILTNINVSKTIVGQVKEVSTDYSWLDEKFKFRDIGFLEKHKINLGNNNNNGFLEKGRIWGHDHKYQTDQEKEAFKRFSEEDEGGDSDSSSDLFELRDCDLGYYYSSGLPVYETTHMDSIKRGAPISTGGPN